MEWVETTGSSIAEAKDFALDQLGVDEADAEFEVLADVKTGLFGRVKSEARVRARVRPTQPRPKDQGNQRRRRSRSERKDSGDRGVSAPRSVSSEEKNDEESTTDGVVAEDNARPKSRRSRRGGRNRSKAHRNDSVATEEGVPSVDDRDASEVVALDRQGDVATEFLRGLFTESQVVATVSVAIDEEEELVRIAVEGENLGSFIGPRGVALQSLQELVRTVVQRKTGARNGRILLDVAQYREKRKVALERFTRQVAEEVKSAGAQKVLEPMSPADRKIVHDTINDIDGVATTSEGEEPRRYVVIRPAS